MPKREIIPDPPRCISMYDFDFDTSMDPKFLIEDPFKSRVFRWFFRVTACELLSQVQKYHKVPYIALCIYDFNMREFTLKSKLLFCSYYPTIQRLNKLGVRVDNICLFPTYMVTHIDP